MPDQLKADITLDACSSSILLQFVIFFSKRVYFQPLMHHPPVYESCDVLSSVELVKL